MSRTGSPPPGGKIESCWAPHRAPGRTVPPRSRPASRPGSPTTDPGPPVEPNPPFARHRHGALVRTSNMNTNVALLMGLLAGSLGGCAALQTFLGEPAANAAHGRLPSTRTANHRDDHLPLRGPGGSTHQRIGYSVAASQSARSNYSATQDYTIPARHCPHFSLPRHRPGPRPRTMSRAARASPALHPPPTSDLIRHPRLLTRPRTSHRSAVNRRCAVPAMPDVSERADLSPVCRGQPETANRLIAEQTRRYALPPLVTNRIPQLDIRAVPGA